MSINNAKNSIKTIVMNDELISEFLELKNDEIFEFCRKNSKQKFTREEFLQVVKEILMFSFPEECGATVLDEGLEIVAGGSRLVTKLAAWTLALTSAGSSLFVESDMPFFKSSASAISLFGFKKKYEIPKPWEVDEVIEAVRNEKYFSDIKEYEKMLKDLENEVKMYEPEEANGSKKKPFEPIDLRSVDGRYASLNSLVECHIENNAIRRYNAQLQYDAMQAKKRYELAKGRRFKPLLEYKSLHDKRDNANEFKKVWESASSEKGKKVGQIWWEENISKNCYYVNCSSGAGGIMSGLFNGLMRNVAGNKGDDESDVDLSIITSLQMVYWKKILEMNNFFNSNISISCVEDLLKSKEFRDAVDDCFGTYVKQIPTGSTIVYSPFPASIQMQSVAQAHAQQIEETENAILMDRAKRYAPYIALSSAAFFASGAMQNLWNFCRQSINLTGIALKKAYNRFIYNRLTLEKDPVKLMELISEYLKSNIMCQDRAIDKLVEIISGMADFWYKSDMTGDEGGSACTMVFMGDSGVGKTFSARWLSKALFHKDMQPWQFITSTAVTSSKTSQSSSDTSAANTEVLSPADQLFNVNSEMVRQLKLNNRVVIVIDEIDKIHKFDPDDTIVERLRDARDTGKLLVRDGVNNSYIDVSRTVFILITNERRECWGLPAVELTPEQAASRTYVERDRSLVNRFDIVEFDYFTSEGYQTVLRPQLEELAEEYRDNYNINIKITDELLKSIGDAAERRNKGVRGVNDYLIALRGKLVDYRSKHKMSLKDENYVDLSVIYDQKTNSFELIDSEESLTNETDVDVSDISDKDATSLELVDAKESLTHDKDADMFGISDHGISSSKLINDPIREIGR